jgi:hypothetical protein
VASGRVDTLRHFNLYEGALSAQSRAGTQTFRHAIWPQLDSIPTPQGALTLCFEQICRFSPEWITLALAPSPLHPGLAPRKDDEKYVRTR